MENPILSIKGGRLQKQLSALFWLLIAATLIAFAAFLYLNEIFAPSHLMISATIAAAGLVTLVITLLQAKQNRIDITVYANHVLIKKGRIVATIPASCFQSITRSGERIKLTIDGLEKPFVIPSSVMTKKEFNAFKEYIEGGEVDV